MRPTPGWAACVPAALLLALVFGLREHPRAVAGDPAAVHDPDAHPELASVHDGTAIGVVLRANGNEVPKNGAELMRALRKVGDFAELPVPFSAVALDSGLTNPRVVIAPRPRHMLSRLANRPDPVAELGGGLLPFPGGPQALRIGARAARRAAADTPPPATKPDLDGRLFLAANLEKDLAGELRVKTVEFISWNGRKGKFDFGVIDCSDQEPELRILDGVRCVSCHKNRGPIFGSGPWSNTTNNDVVREAVRVASERTARPDGLGGLGGQDLDRRPPPPPRSGGACDGMTQVVNQTPGEAEFIDAAVRLGGEIVRDREVYRAMARTGDGRKAIVLLLAGTVGPHPTVAEVNQTFNATSAQFAHQFVNLHKSMSSTLVDFSPAGSMGVLRSVTTNTPTGWGGGSTMRADVRLVWGGGSQQVLAYDARRAAGDHGLPSHRQPSNPRAFARTDAPVPVTPAAAVNAESLAGAIGLTRGDREVLAQALATAVRKIDKPKVTTTTLAREVFNGPKFADALKAGDLPDREDFKERFVTGLAAAARAHGADDLGVTRRDYASTPIWALTGGPESREPAAVPTTACLGCHDVQGANARKGFNPIPALAFDPFDTTAREAWMKTADPKKRKQVLARLAQRLVTDKDMPPEDAAEYEVFRQKDPAAFDAVREFLEAELAKAGR